MSFLLYTHFRSPGCCVRLGRKFTCPSRCIRTSATGIPAELGHTSRSLKSSGVFLLQILLGKNEDMNKRLVVCLLFWSTFLQSLHRLCIESYCCYPVNYMCPKTRGKARRHERNGFPRKSQKREVHCHAPLTAVAGATHLTKMAFFLHGNSSAWKKGELGNNKPQTSTVMDLHLPQQHCICLLLRVCFCINCTTKTQFAVHFSGNRGSFWFAHFGQ